MRLSAYQSEAKRTLSPVVADHQKHLAIMGLGLAGEAGEVIEHLKKHLGHGKELSRADLEKELGDVMWYVAAIATLTGIDLDVVAMGNVEKLRARYPDGFRKEGEP